MKKLLFLNFLIPIYLFGSQISRNTPNLVGLWHLNENAGVETQDSSANGGTGLLVWQPTWVSGDSASAVNFSLNALNRVELANINLTDFGKNDAFYVVLRFKPTNATVNSYLIAKRVSTAGGNPGWGIHQSQIANGDFMMEVFGSGTDFCRMVTPGYPASFFIARKWHTMIGFWDGTNSCSGMGLYIDGVLATSIPQNTGGSISTDFKNSTCTSIGGMTTAGQAFAGGIDEVAIYRGRLTAGDAKRIHHDFTKGQDISN